VGEPGSDTAAVPARLLSAAPDDPAVAVRTYRAALRIGDMVLAERAAATLRRAGVAPPDAALLPLARAAWGGDRAAMDKAVAALSGTTLAILGPALRVWAEPRSSATTLSGVDPAARRLASEAQALRLLVDGPVEDGLERLQAMGGAALPIDVRVTAAQALVARGRRDEAAALLGEGGAVRDVLLDPRERRLLVAGFGVSRLLGRVAADLAADEGGPVAVTLARAALVAEPGNGRAALVLADILSRSRSHDLALAALALVSPGDPFAATAAAARVEVLDRAGRAGDAQVLAERLASAPLSGAADWQRLAQLYGRGGRWPDAVPLYARVAASPEGRGDWAAWMQYGEALERAGRWPEARAALTKAVAIAPDEPLALNYLGYASAEHGEPIAESQKLLERASRLRPDDTSIADSLGWTYHLGGATPRALPLIERAAADQPDNAEIAEHLGDVYWALGRRYEARYQWRTATMLAGSAAPERLARKLANGAESVSSGNRR